MGTSLFNFLNSPKKLSFKKRQNEPLDEVSYSIQISFDTNGQIRYLDENERPRIVEFVGNSWSKSLLQSSSNKTSAKTSAQTTSTIALTSDDKNVLKRLIQITGLLLVILTIIYLVVGSYVAYRTYVEPTLKPAPTPE